jgi:hypothetical protein
MKRTILLAIIAPALSTGLAHGATTIFGSDNDGLGGFNAVAGSSIASPAPAWTITSTGAVFTNAPTPAVPPDPNPDSGQVNSSLLKEYVLNRSSGNTYTITGVADLTSTYAADNNRLGISLFATADTLAGIDSGLSLQVNLGGGILSIRNGGVNGSSTVSSASLSGAAAGDLISETLIYTAVLGFTGTDIDVSFTLAAPDLSYSQTISGTVDAASFPGEHFGFGSRGRVRNGNADFIYDAKSFSVVPEPSSALLAGLFGAAVLLRRRR